MTSAVARRFISATPTQLAHNEWDAKAGHSVVRVLHSFGREDLIDRAAIERLIGSLERWLDPGAPPRPAAGSGPGLRFVESRPIGQPGARAALQARGEQVAVRAGVDRRPGGVR
jgi:hypothetical protein